jgi:hypothetical protein
MTTMPTLSQICAAVQDVLAAQTGIRFAPDIPPEQIASGDATGMVYPATGTFEQITCGSRESGRHTLHVMISTPRTYLRANWATVIGLGDTVPRALFVAGTLSSTVLQVLEVRYTFGGLEWAGQQLFGWLFEVDVLGVGGLA